MAGKAQTILIDLTDHNAGCDADHNLRQEIILVLEQDAKLDLKIIGYGEIKINLQLKIEFLGQKAVFNLNSALWLLKNSLVQINILQNHTIADCQSWVLVKTVLEECTNFDYAGEIFIGKNASQTIAHQQNQNIVCDSRVSVKSKPSINVLNADVACGHGSATGELDREQIIYLTSRGLEHSVAIKLLKESFLGLKF